MLRAQTRKTIAIHDSDIQTILFRNFRGAADKYNKEGKRTFVVVPTEEKAAELEEMGFRIVRRKFDDGSSEPRLKVNVRFENFPPKVFLGTDPKRMVRLNEEDVGQIDSAELKSVDLLISPYRYEDYLTAYLDKGYFVIEPDAFTDKYEEFRGDVEDDALPFDV